MANRTKKQSKKVRKIVNPQIRNGKIRRNKKTNKSFTIFISILVVVFTLYAIGKLYNLAHKPKIESIVLTKMDIRKSDRYKGIIIRDEKVYQATKAGYLKIDVKDSDKIMKNDIIFETSDQQEVAGLTDQLNSINESLFSLQKFREEYSMYKNDIDNIENHTKKIVDNWQMGSYKDIYSLSNAVDDNTAIRNQIIFSDQRVVDNTTMDKKSIIQSKIDTSINKTISEEGGIVSYNVDGLESTFTPTTMENLTIDQTKMDAKSKTNTNLQVTTGDNILKIIQSNTWYIGSYIPAAAVGTINEGDQITLFLNDNGDLKEIDAVVNKIQDKGDNKYVIFELKTNILDYIDKRNVDVTLKTTTFENMKVPKTAIISKEMLKIPANYITKTDKNVVLKKTESQASIETPILVDSYDATGQFAYLDKSKNTLKVGDVLVQTGQDQSPYTIGSTITFDGVYKINNGTAEYDKVVENAEVAPSDEYVYILPNSKVKEYDRILVNANSVIENQIID